MLFALLKGALVGIPADLETRHCRNENVARPRQGRGGPSSVLDCRNLEAPKALTQK